MGRWEKESPPNGSEPRQAELELFREPSSTEDHDPFSGAEGSPSRSHLRPPVPKRRILAVSGAKGGVGKTLLSTNLALFLATIGRRVVVVDADVTGANAHSFFGIERPGGVAPYVPPAPSFGMGFFDDPVDEPALEIDLAPGETDPRAIEHAEFGAALVETSIPGLRLLHAGLDEPAPGGHGRAKRKDLLARLSKLDAEYVVVDLGAGIDPSLLRLWSAASSSVFVSVPEPTAIENTYRFIRAAFASHLFRGIADREARARLRARFRAFGHMPAPLDFVRRLEAEGDAGAPLVRAAMASFRFPLVLNQTRLRADLELGDRIGSAARRRLGVSVDYLGYIDFDDTVWTCIRVGRPLLVESPGSKASRNLEKIARRLLAIEAGKGRPRGFPSVPPETHHDLLEVERGATDEEIRRAYKRAREVYSSDSLCCYGLFDGPGLEALRARLDEAYDVLLDPARRRPYELSVFPPEPDAEAELPPESKSDEPKPPPPIITPDTEFTGGLLRAVRESQGVDLRTISHRTKIGTAYLTSIEGDEFGNLPAPVYVRGFVTELAKCLKLDAEQVARSYLRRYRRYMEERGRF